ncbi:MAG TPA: hypothetical protein VGD27_16830, partial [Longimicrobiales bacterium]
MSTIDPTILEQRVREQDEQLRELRAQLAEWEAAFDKLPRRQGETKTLSGNPVEPLYSPVHIAGDDA